MAVVVVAVCAAELSGLSDDRGGDRAWLTKQDWPCDSRNPVSPGPRWTPRNAPRWYWWWRSLCCWWWCIGTVGGALFSGFDLRQSAAAPRQQRSRKGCYLRHGLLRVREHRHAGCVAPPPRVSAELQLCTGASWTPVLTGVWRGPVDRCCCHVVRDRDGRADRPDRQHRRGSGAAAPARPGRRPAQVDPGAVEIDAGRVALIAAAPILGVPGWAWTHCGRC